jgi:hypothetical protein
MGMGKVIRSSEELESLYFTENEQISYKRKGKLESGNL